MDSEQLKMSHGNDVMNNLSHYSMGKVVESAQYLKMYLRLQSLFSLNLWKIGNESKR